MSTNLPKDRRLGHVVDSVLQTEWTDRETKVDREERKTKLKQGEELR